MTQPLSLTRKQLARLERNLSGTAPKKGNELSKSKLMTIHLWAVEKIVGRIDPKELRSEKFTKSRADFLKWAQQWKE